MAKNGERTAACIAGLVFSFATCCLQGKVRDTYELDDKLVIVTTDRQSAFDRLLASIPFKGQVRWLGFGEP
jgi:phosphoribosylaminoimidazole-succinocarboxamide synthase